MTKEKAKEILKKGAVEADEKYDELLEALEGNHKPDVARSRIFVAGAIAGALVVVLLVLIF